MTGMVVFSTYTSTSKGSVVCVCDALSVVAVFVVALVVVLVIVFIVVVAGLFTFVAVDVSVAFISTAVVLLVEVCDLLLGVSFVVCLLTAGDRSTTDWVELISESVGNELERNCVVLDVVVVVNAVVVFVVVFVDAAVDDDDVGLVGVVGKEDDDRECVALLVYVVVDDCTAAVENGFTAVDSDVFTASESADVVDKVELEVVSCVVRGSVDDIVFMMIFIVVVVDFDEVAGTAVITVCKVVLVVAASESVVAGVDGLI